MINNGILYQGVTPGSASLIGAGTTLISKDHMLATSNECT